MKLASTEDTTAAKTLARGDRQKSLICGTARPSGSDLTGKAKQYSSKYRESMLNMLARLNDAGIEAAVENVKGDDGRSRSAISLNGGIIKWW